MNKPLKRPQSGLPPRKDNTLLQIGGERETIQSIIKNQTIDSSKEKVDSCLDPNHCPFCLKKSANMMYEFSVDFVIRIYQNLL